MESYSNGLGGNVVIPPAVTISSPASTVQKPIPAAYGRACLSCVKAKCKCLTRTGANGCERCLRLGKQCRPAETIRGQSKSNKVTRLEEKLDGIISLLKSGNEPVANNIDGHNLAFRTAGGGSLDGNTTSANYGIIERPAPSNYQVNIDGPPFLNPTPSYTVPGSHYIEQQPLTPSSSNLQFKGNETFQTTHHVITGISFEESEKYLAHFRTQVVVDFAFLHTPESMSAQRLQQKRPFLFLVIMAVSSSSRMQRLELGREIKDTLAREFFGENDASFDVLLGLLVFLTWGHDHFVKKKYTSHQPRFMHLAISILFELRLNKPPLKEPFSLLDLRSNNDEEHTHPKSWSLEERRAVLGCYVISSFISWYYGKTDPIRWTPYFDECLETVSRERQAPTDEVFCHQVRLQLIAERASQMASTAAIDRIEAPRTSLPFYLKAFRSQIDDVKRKVSPGVQDHGLFLGYLHHTELCINALALSKESIVSYTTGFERLNCLSACLTYIKSWFEIFFARPLENYLCISFPTFAQLAHFIVMLHRLSALQDPAWDRGLVRETLDIAAVLDQLIHNFGQLKEGTEDGELFGKMAMVFGLVKELSMKALGRDLGGENAGVVREVPDASMQDFSMMNRVGMDDAWLSEMFGSWSYDFMAG